MFVGLITTLLVILSIFLILLILVQRGRGGGLAGALGGMGGQSAFGTKAGDLFTRITIGVAACWIILCIIAVQQMGSESSRFSNSQGQAARDAAESSPANADLESGEIPVTSSELPRETPAPDSSPKTTGTPVSPSP